MDTGRRHMLTSMDDYVLGQVPHIHKGLATHAALVWSDVVMVANVIGQLAGLDESIGPQITRLMLTHRSYGVCVGWSLGGTHHSGTQPGTWPHAPWSGGRPLPLATALTDVGLLPRVLAHMGDEGAGLSEGFATHHTLAWLLTWGRGTRH